MHIYKQINEQIRRLAEGLHPELSTAKISCDAPKDASHGDMATNAAMVLAAASKGNSRDIANKLLPLIQALPEIASAEIAGPGFINLRLKTAIWQQLVSAILQDGTAYGKSALGERLKVNLEYVSANPTGPMHVGHGRGAVFGDALASLLEFAGYDVTREYYVNDAGGQVDKLAESAYFRYREACGEEIGAIPQGLYPGDYLVEIGIGLKIIFKDSLLKKKKSEWLAPVRDFTLEAIMAMIKDDLAILGIAHDNFVSERKITAEGKVEEAMALLEKKGLIYTGVLEAPKGKAPEDWEPRPQTLFKAKEFGDDEDRALKKSDGSWTYFAPDVAYHYDKCQRGYAILVDIFGADHGGYVKRIKAAVKALSNDTVKVEVKLCQIVKFLRDGVPAKMSKRAGTFVTVREVVEEVGKDVFRFIMLTRKNDAPLDFDFAKVMEQSKDNPVFYVQYAHARAKSAIRHIGNELPAALALADSAPASVLHTLTHADELALIRQMAVWPKLVESAAEAFEPHRVAFYLHDLAASFHALWNVGNDDLSLRFLQKSAIELTAARLLMARALATVIASGLVLLGVEPKEEMR